MKELTKLIADDMKPALGVTEPGAIAYATAKAKSYVEGEVDWMDDDWTVVTRDHSLSAHYENTVLITEGEPKLLTLTSNV